MANGAPSPFDPDFGSKLGSKLPLPSHPIPPTLRLVYRDRPSFYKDLAFAQRARCTGATNSHVFCPPPIELCPAWCPARIPVLQAAKPRRTPFCIQDDHQGPEPGRAQEAGKPCGNPIPRLTRSLCNPPIQAS